MLSLDAFGDNFIEKLTLTHGAQSSHSFAEIQLLLQVIQVSANLLLGWRAGEQLENSCSLISAYARALKKDGCCSPKPSSSGSTALLKLLSNHSTTSQSNLSSSLI